MPLINRTLTIRQLNQIDAGRIDRSKDLRVKLVNSYKILQKTSFFQKILKFLGFKETLNYYRLFKYAVKSNSGSTYTVFIQVSPGFKQQFYDNKIKVFCSCADFMFRSAYNLNKSDNLFLNKATKIHLDKALEIAPTTVPGGTTHICKHVYACLMDFRYKVHNQGILK